MIAREFNLDTQDGPLKLIGVLHAVINCPWPNPLGWHQASLFQSAVSGRYTLLATDYLGRAVDTGTSRKTRYTRRERYWQAANLQGMLDHFPPGRDTLYARQVVTELFGGEEAA